MMNRPDLNVINRAGDKAREFERSANQVTVPTTTKLGLATLLRETFKDAKSDHLGAFAGNLTFNGLLAIFPCFLFLLSLLAIFHLTETVNTVLMYIRTTLPIPVFQMIHDQVVPLMHSHEIGNFTLGAAAYLAFALCGMAWGFSAIMEAMNVMYDVEEIRPVWRKYVISIIMSVAMVVLFAGAFVVVVFGPAVVGTLAHRVGLETTFWLLWSIMRWFVLVFFVLLTFALIYWAAANSKHSFKFFTPGIITAVTLWLVFSLLFAQYVNHSGSYNAIYGEFTRVVVLLLYMYCSSYIFLFGAEMDQVIQKQAHAHGDEGVPSSVVPHPGSTGKSKSGT